MSAFFREMASQFDSSLTGLLAVIIIMSDTGRFFKIRVLRKDV